MAGPRPVSAPRIEGRCAAACPPPAFIAARPLVVSADIQYVAVPPAGAAGAAGAPRRGWAIAAAVA
ncbi:MAG TPA: hypothetical protein VLK25_07025, partial [Allosphingosinicella sp.]|nr:hypothetical protein [Allosphingosinicella sp.]